MKKLFNAMDKAGLNYRLVTIVNRDDSTSGVMVEHNYNGMYPDRNAIDKAAAAARIANKYNLKCEKRGHGVATLIFLPV